MALTATVCVRCDAPGCSARGPVTGRFSLVRRLAVEQGWRRARRPKGWPGVGPVDLCPEHAEQARR